MNSTSTLVLKQPANLSQLCNQFNNATENHTIKDPGSTVKCNYYIENISNPRDIEIRVWCPAGSVLPHQERVPL